MILTCTSCDTRFSVDPRSLAPNGRTVRCGNCGHVWDEGPPRDPAGTTTEPPPALGGGSSVPSAVGAGEKGEAVAPVRPAPASRTQERRRRRGAAAAWLGLAASLAVAVVGAVIYRDAVMGLWPPSADLYRLAGLAPTVGLRAQHR